jgi:hypothetical protein
MVWALAAAGAVYTIISGVLLICALVSLSAPSELTRPLFFAAAGGLMAAVMSFGMAQLFGAIRDMAINSWKQVILLQDVREHTAQPGVPNASSEPDPMSATSYASRGSFSEQGSSPA